MSTESTDTAPPRSRWMKPLLIGSLALNLLVAGGIASAVWRHHHGHRPFGPRGGGDFSLMGFANNLPADRQKAVIDQVQAAREAVKPIRQEVRDAWAASNAVLTVEPFDKSKAKEASARLIAAETKFKTAVSDALIDTAEKLTPEERKSLQEWRERRRAGHHRRHEKWNGGPPGPDSGPDPDRE